jgi:hypothetical protein
MSLLDFVIPTQTFKSPNGGSFAVRGLSLNDVTTLLNSSETELRAMFNIFLGVDQNAAASDLLQTAVPALQQFPKLASLMIALASDEPEAAAVVAKLPMQTQIDALEAILRLSFDAEGGPGKFFDTVTRAFNGITTLSRSGTVSKI